MADAITIDTSSFTRFARDIRKCSTLVSKNLKAELKQAGEIVAIQARLNASFSTRIPATIKVRSAGGVIRVIAGGQSAPHKGEAEAFEHKGVPGTFRHPVYGNKKKWVNQRAHPYLRTAAETHRKAALDAAERAVQKAFREAGLH